LVNALGECSADPLKGLGGRGGKLLGVVTSIGRGDCLGVELIGEMGCFKYIDTSRRSVTGVDSLTGSRAVTRRPKGDFPLVVFTTFDSVDTKRELNASSGVHVLLNRRTAHLGAIWGCTLFFLLVYKPENDGLSSNNSWFKSRCFLSLVTNSSLVPPPLSPNSTAISWSSDFFLGGRAPENTERGIVVGAE
jgi:hypothetical protein